MMDGTLEYVLASPPLQIRTFASGHHASRVGS